MVPAPPANYRPATLIERHRDVSENALAHNHRLGWLLQLVDRHGLIPVPDAPPHLRAALVLQLLPDLFDDLDQAARYTANIDDAELALGLLGSDATPDSLTLDTGELMTVIRAAEATGSS
ncbi:MAG: hypothetical protein AAFU41_08365 [Pseudomonadota bacterium]